MGSSAYIDGLRCVPVLVAGGVRRVLEGLVPGKVPEGPVLVVTSCFTLYRFGMELLQVTAVWFRKVQGRC